MFVTVMVTMSDASHGFLYTTRKEDIMPQQSGWQLSGNAPAAYERYIIPAFMGTWAQDLVDVAAVQAGERVLDVACGTGVVARQAATVTGATGQVIGLDVNTGMLDMAHTVPTPPGAFITWEAGDAAALPFPAASFDAVLCQQGLQYLPDRKGALREMARVLVPGGRLALSVWRPLKRLPFFVALVDALEHHLSAEIAAPLHAAFTLGDADELRSLITEAGFHDVHLRLKIKLIRYTPLEDFIPGYLAATPMAGAVAAMDDTARTAMFHDITTVLQPYTDDDGLAAPMECHIVTAQT
jgi:ubiquinone/menaquinone biosynthesis C-methylase UbiE